MGTYVLSHSTPKAKLGAEFQRIKASEVKARRRNMKYRGKLTIFRKSQQQKKMLIIVVAMLTLLVSNIFYTAVSNMYSSSFIIYPVDELVGIPEVVIAANSIAGQDVPAGEKSLAVLPVLVETGTVAEREIYIYNEAIKHKVNPDYAIRIAKSESHPYLDPYAKNPKSTAKGIYQFINSTWAENCKGDVYDWKDNVDCFMDNFNQHPQWWQESLDIEGIKIKSKI